MKNINLLARYSPFSHIEVLSSREPIHSTFFRPRRHKLIPLAGTILTRCVKLFSKIAVLMSLHLMSTETFRILPESKAFRFFLLVPKSDLQNNLFWGNLNF